MVLMASVMVLCRVKLKLTGNLRISTVILVPTLKSLNRPLFQVCNDIGRLKLTVTLFIKENASGARPIVPTVAENKNDRKL